MPAFPFAAERLPSSAAPHAEHVAGLDFGLIRKQRASLAIQVPLTSLWTFDVKWNRSPNSASTRTDSAVLP